MDQIAIVGAGISGLTAAYELTRRGFSVRVLEARSRVGGVIRTERTDGFLIEHGPNSVRASTDTLRGIIDDLALGDEVVTANEAASTRYVVRNGRPRALPTSVGAFATTNLFSACAKLRLLAEPFVPRRSDSASPESVAQFVRRRLGPEVLDYAVAPFVGGVFAGRPDALSVDHAFERLAGLEDEYGSVLWGGIRTALEGSSSQKDGGPSGLFSFRDGLETLPKALAEKLIGRIQRNTPVTGVRETDDGWTVQTEGASLRPFDAVLSTVPLHALPPVDLQSSVDTSPLRAVPYPPVAVVALGYERDAIEHPLDGFGVLVPPVETQFDILGTIFSSTLFPNRAPAGHVLLTTFVGGGRAPNRADMSNEKIQATVERDLDRLLGVAGDPVFVRSIRWPHAIPQYTLDHGTTLDTLTALEASGRGLFFAGNYRQGVSVGDAMASGAAAAKRAAASITEEG